MQAFGGADMNHPAVAVLARRQGLKFDCDFGAFLNRETADRRYERVRVSHLGSSTGRNRVESFLVTLIGIRIPDAMLIEQRIQVVCPDHCSATDSRDWKASGPRQPFECCLRQCGEVGCLLPRLPTSDCVHLVVPQNRGWFVLPGRSRAFIPIDEERCPISFAAQNGSQRV